MLAKRFNVELPPEDEPVDDDDFEDSGFAGFDGMADNDHVQALEPAR